MLVIHRRLYFSCLVCVAIVGGATGAIAGPDDVLFERHVIEVDDLHFGRSVDAVRDTAVVGAPGVAYVFARLDDGWDFVKKLRPDPGQSNDGFGAHRGVAIDGDTIAVAAYKHDGAADLSGAVYLFERNAGGEGAWGQVDMIVQPDGGERDYFGSDVRLKGDTLVVGADGRGAAYVFDRDPDDNERWLLTAILTPSGPATRFGAAVDFDGDRVVVGASSDITAPIEGSVWVFERNAGGPNAWGEVAALETPDSVRDSFGWSVAILGRWLVVGAPKTPPQKEGSVYVYEEGGAPGEWVLHTQLHPFDSASEFGYAVAMAPDQIVVGHTDLAGPKFVFGYRYAENADQWRETVKLGLESGGTGGLGRALAITDEEVWAGAFTYESVFVFVPNPKVTLTVAGVCGADPRIDIERATSNGDVELLTSGAEGSGTIPVGPCAGIETGLSRPERLVSQPADDRGELSVVLDTPVADCKPLLQVLDTGSCQLSDIEMIDRLDIVRESRFFAPSPGHYGLFGSSVDVEGDVALVGEPTSFGTGTGWIYERSEGQWSMVAGLVPPEPERLAGLGQSLALSGDVAVLGGPGCPEYSKDPGVSWVFERDDLGAWNPTVRLQASDGVARDLFGDSVAIDNDLIAVGATQTTVYRGAGSAYLYGRDTGGANAWGEVAKLDPPDLEEDDLFGDAVDLSNGIVAVGSPRDDDAGRDAGAVYLFEETAPGVWGVVAKLTASDATTNDEFGKALAIEGDRLVVGAPRANGADGPAGAVYVFQREADTATWIEVHKVRPADTGSANGTGPFFGGSVDLDGPLLVVGEYQDEGGNVYLFREIQGLWPQLLRVPRPQHLTRDDNFGRAVAIDGDTIIVGTSSEDGAQDNQGAVYPMRWERPITAVAQDVGCPGSARHSIDGAMPDSSFAVLAGLPGGTSSVSVGACVETEVDLDRPVLAEVVLTDSAGRAEVQIRVSGEDCAKEIRWVDLATCSMLPPAE